MTPSSLFQASSGGSPIHVGNPEKIGIADLGRPTYGDMITHEPGIMFLTDLPREGESRRWRLGKGGVVPDRHRARRLPRRRIATCPDFANDGE